jgi:hypothetical protein
MLPPRDGDVGRQGPDEVVAGPHHGDEVRADADEFGVHHPGGEEMLPVLLAAPKEGLDACGDHSAYDDTKEPEEPCPEHVREPMPPKARRTQGSVA